MQTKDYLQYIVEKVHATVFATVDGEGRPAPTGGLMGPPAGETMLSGLLAGRIHKGRLSEMRSRTACRNRPAALEKIWYFFQAM